MSARTPQELAEDREATDLASCLYRTLLTLEKSDTVLVNAVAGLLGALVVHVAEPGKEEAVMRMMASQARDQMRLQMRMSVLGRTVGNA